MGYAIAFIVGVIIGAVAVALVVMELRSRLKVALRETQDKDASLARRLQAVEQQAGEIEAERQALAGHKITLEEYSAESAMLKRDLQNIHVELSKLQLDRQLQGEKQDALDKRSEELGARYLQENIKWIGSSLNANNFASAKKKLLTVIERCRGIGYEVSPDHEARLLAELKQEFEKAVRAALEREEQARIKARIREEQQREREVERELKQLERERAAIQAALDRALAEAKDQHSEEVERLRSKLADAEARAERTKSQAELTKSGHVYVISNIGSFGEGVFKIGMTRRLEPLLRIRELGDASVPFPFDVHMMVSSDNAPKLENALHREFHHMRVNRINPRKEYFRVDLETIRDFVVQNHGEVEYVADAEALEYRQSIEMSDDDSDYIEQVYEEASDEAGVSLEDDE
jgi:hypothetical protein